MRMWKRCVYGLVFASAIGVAAEQRSCAPSTLTPPETAAEWKLASAMDCEKPVPPRFQIWDGTRRAWRVCRTSYNGPALVTLTLYEMPESPGATAFDAWQRALLEPGRMSFYKGGYFGVAQAPGADRSTLDRFVVAIEAVLPRGSEGRW
jgi:hypothetical protein